MIQKKYLLWGIGFLIIVSVIGGVMLFLRDNKNVTFTIDYPEGSAVISDTQDRSKKFATLKNNTSLWLNKKTYYIFFENEGLNHDPQAITVDNATSTVALDPSYSSEKLQSLLAGEQKAIDAEIKKSISSSVPYTPAKGSLYHRGEWYATTVPVFKASSLDPDIANPDDVDNYYIVLKKTDNNWKLVSKPSLILTKPDNPNIPDYIIDALNPVQNQF
jgi:hypothetical protein